MAKYYFYASAKDLSLLLVLVVMFVDLRLLAVKLLGRKIFIIEQNAIVGLTNRLLAGISTLVFTNFKETKG